MQDSRVAAAKREGEVVWFVAVPTGREEIADAFHRRFGITVRIVNEPGGPLVDRFTADVQLDRVVADVLTFGPEPAFVHRALGAGWIDRIGDVGLPVIESGQYPVDRFMVGATATVQAHVFAIGYDVDALAPRHVPRRWTDLANPVHAGRLGLPSPRTSDAYVQHWALLRSSFGDEFLRGVATNSPTYFVGAAPVAESLQLRTHAVVASIPPARLEQVRRSGVNIDYVIPDLVTGTELGVLLTAQRRAPHPNAAQIFANFLLSPEAGDIVRRSGALSVYDDAFPSDYVRAPAHVASNEREEIIALLGA